MNVHVKAQVEVKINSQVKTILKSKSTVKLTPTFKSNRLSSRTQLASYKPDSQVNGKS